jgi:hypothetical protein
MSEHRPLPSPFGVDICADCGLVFDGYQGDEPCKPSARPPEPADVRACVEMFRKRGVKPSSDFPPEKPGENGPFEF